MLCKTILKNRLIKLFLSVSPPNISYEHWALPAHVNTFIMNGKERPDYVHLISKLESKSDLETLDCHSRVGKITCFFWCSVELSVVLIKPGNSFSLG